MAPVCCDYCWHYHSAGGGAGEAALVGGEVENGVGAAGCVSAGWQADKATTAIAASKGSIGMGLPSARICTHIGQTRPKFLPKIQPRYADLF
jgi:hypothetical protein